MIVTMRRVRDANEIELTDRAGKDEETLEQSVMVFS